MSHHRSSWIGFTALALVLACTDGPMGPTAHEPGASGVVSTLVPGPASAHVGADILHFLPPVMPQAPQPEFDRSLAEWIAVHVCAYDGPDCVEVTRFDAESPGSRRVRLSENHYLTTWSTEGLGIGMYRLHISVAGLDVGGLDLRVQRGWITNMLTGASLGRVGRTLPVAFRIDADPAVRARVMTEIGATSVEIAGQLHAEFGSDEADISALLYTEGFDASATGEALKLTFPDVTPEVAGTAMFEAGYEPVDVAHSLYDWWKANSPVIIPLLEAFGLTPEDVAWAVVDVYDFTAEQLVEALAAAEWGVDKVARGLDYVFSLEGHEIIDILAASGEWTVTQIVGGLHEGLNWSKEAIAWAIGESGITAEDAMAALETVFVLGAQGMLALVEASDWADEQIVKALDAVYNFGAGPLAAFLKAAGWTASKVSVGLQYAGYASSAVTNAIENAWGEASDWYCRNVGWPFC